MVGLGQFMVSLGQFAVMVDLSRVRSVHGRFGSV